MDYLKRLNGVDPRLIACLMIGASNYERDQLRFDVRVTSGRRTIEEQRKLMAEGKSQVEQPWHSYHTKGKAADLALISRSDGSAHWGHDAYERLNHFVQKAALGLGVHVTWGGTWITLVDAVHWQIETLRDDPAWGEH